MAPVSWLPKRRTLEQDLAEELARLEAIQPQEPLISETMPEAEPRGWQPMAQLAQPVAQEWMPSRMPTAQPSVPQIQALPLPQQILTLQPEVVPEPWYKAIVEKIAVPFEWIKENLEEPWAEMITAPFRPAGVSYDKWEAPKFVKGIAEFSMPLWWLPYFGWAAKGASLIPRVGGSLAKGILSAERTMALPITLPLKAVGKVVPKIIKLPKFEQLRQNIFRQDRFRLLAEKLSVLPGFRSAIGVVNPSAVAHGLAQEGKVIYGGLREYASNSVNAVMAQLETHGTSPQIARMFGLDDVMRSTTIKPRIKDAPLNWWDIASNPKAYHLDAAQKSFIDDYGRIIDDVVTYAEKEFGIKIKKREFLEGMRYIPRVWQGKVGLFDAETGIFRGVGTAIEKPAGEKIMEIPLRAGMPAARIGVKAFFEKPRVYEFAEEALAAGLRPGAVGPMETMDIFLNGMYRKMVDTMTANALKPLGKTIKELTPVAIRLAVSDAAVRVRGLQRLVNVIPRAKRGEVLPSATISAIKRVSPELSEKLESALALKGAEKATALTTLRREAEAVRKAASLELQAARTERKRAYEIARGMPGWRTVGQPFAAGRLFPEEIANDLNKMLTDRAMPIFTKLSNVNALSRFMVTGFDFGAGLIQGVPLLMSNPLKWGRAMGLSVKAFGDPLVRARYISRPENIAVLEKLIPEGLLIGNSEFMQATGRGLLRSQPVQAIDRLNTIQRFASSFNTFGDIARIEWAKGLLPMVERQGKSLKELTAFINEATGVMSSRALGIGATQREMEAAVFLFAPRYFRANISLWADMTRGGLRGQLARDTMASMLMGGFFWYYGASKALGQEPEFNPSTGRFMTLQIGNQHIGLGSMQVAMFRLLGNIYRTATEDPEGFIALNSRDNPLIRFMRSRVAPITGASWDILTGKTFIGEPLDTPKSWGENILADKLLPFWLASYISDYPKPGWASAPAEIFGARTWPLQLWERQNELRERLAQAEYGKPWYATKTQKGINELQKKQLEEKYDDLRQATEASMTQRLERGGAKEQMWAAFQDARKRARAVYEGNLWGAQELFDKGEITGYDFKELSKTAGAELRGAYRNIESDPANEEVMEFLNQPMTEQQMRDTPIEDIAFDIYMSLMYSGDLEDAAGQYDFNEAEKRRQIFVAQFGEEILQYIQDRLSQGKDVPPLMQEYYKAREVLRPYWLVADRALKLFGQPKTEWQQRRLDRAVSKVRKQMRASNPEMEKYFLMFYSRNT